MLKNLNWKTIAVAGLIMGAYGACKYFHITEPAWLDSAVAVLGIGIVAYMQSAINSTTQTTTVTATLTEPKPPAAS